MKKKFIFLTRSSKKEALEDLIFNTSSQAYEVNLLRAIANKIETTVVYIGTSDHDSEKNTSKVELKNCGLSFYDFGSLSLLNCRKLLKTIKEETKNCDSVVATTGYFPLEIGLLSFVRSNQSKSYSIVFDTHTQSTASMRKPKRMIANFYFNCGFFFLKGLDGIVVLNDEFIIKNKLFFRYHKSRIGNLYLGKSKKNQTAHPTNSKLRFMFAGTLNEDNGVNLILNYLDMHKEDQVEFFFFGYGRLEELVKTKSSRDPRINYCGVLNDSELDVEMFNYDYLVCFRDPGSPAGLYAFPSKLIKFMGSGVSVISNVFPGLSSEYLEHLVILDEYSPSGLANSITRLTREKNKNELGRYAREFIEKTHRWEDISSRMLDFFYNMNK